MGFLPQGLGEAAAFLKARKPLLSLLPDLDDRTLELLWPPCDPEDTVLSLDGAATVPPSQCSGKKPIRVASRLLVCGTDLDDGSVVEVCWGRTRRFRRFRPDAQAT